MKLLTESINKYLKEVFQKDEFLIADYLLIEYLTVDGKDYEGNKQKVSFIKKCRLNFFSIRRNKRNK